MPNPIEPALSPEQWAALTMPHAGHAFGASLRATVAGWTYGVREPEALVKIIALANAALPDDDPRKITRAWVTELREVSAAIGDRWRQDTTLLDQIADALASYLPPREL